CPHMHPALGPRIAPFFNAFFFSSRRRHTRSKRDWSSDVCSSDLPSFLPVLVLLDPFHIHKLRACRLLLPYHLRNRMSYPFLRSGNHQSSFLLLCMLHLLVHCP